MAIAERLAARDPANSQWQRDLIVSRIKLADTDPGKARQLLMRALELAQQLASSGRLAPTDASMPDDLQNRLAALSKG